MKNVIFFFLVICCFACSSKENDEGSAVNFRCIAKYYHSSLGKTDMKCQFYFFPEGNYNKIVRSATNEVAALPWNAYAVTSAGEVVYSVMQANTEGEWAIPYAVNGYKGSLTKGSFYVVAFPYRIDASSGKYLLYNCYKANSFQKGSDDEQCLVMPTFSYAEVCNYAWFDGEKSEPVKLDWE